ncbi:MAG TPA: hypothetical protein VM308_00325 [Sphingomicrobium sp.]|nr:hypothetical protein [Sphingomicrobium sp.]
MNAERATRLERRVERAAAAVFAAAVAFAAYHWWLPTVEQPTLGAFTGGAAAVAYLVCVRALAALDSRPRFPVPVFDLRAIDPAALTELVLTDADRVDRGSDAPEPLVLDDVLAELGPDSRVVRLFDRQAMPTPGQLQARIDNHLGQQSGAGDASQALSDALAELRRALR